MAQNLRPYTTYKGFGGVVAAFGLGAALANVVAPDPQIEGYNIKFICLTLGIGCAGLVVFIESDRKILERLKKGKNSEESKIDAMDDATPKKRMMDIKAMIITAVIFSSYIILMTLKEKGWL